MNIKQWWRLNKPVVYLSACRKHGFGFIFLWSNGLYVQLGTVKLIVTKPWQSIVAARMKKEDDGTRSLGELLVLSQIQKK